MVWDNATITSALVASPVDLVDKWKYRRSFFSSISIDGCGSRVVGHVRLGRSKEAIDENDAASIGATGRMRIVEIGIVDGSRGPLSLW
mgnify:CR=1 FL=1